MSILLLTRRLFFQKTHLKKKERLHYTIPNKQRQQNYESSGGRLRLIKFHLFSIILLILFLYTWLILSYKLKSIHSYIRFFRIFLYFRQKLQLQGLLIMLSSYLITTEKNAKQLHLTFNYTYCLPTYTRILFGPTGIVHAKNWSF